jgi:hypothetical protein
MFVIIFEVVSDGIEWRVENADGRTSFVTGYARLLKDPAKGGFAIYDIC